MTEMERALVVLYRNLRQSDEEARKEAQDTDPASQWWARNLGMTDAFGLSAKWLRRILERSGIDVEKVE